MGFRSCTGLIKQHNGYIICSSEPKKGTTFKIYLPLSKREIQETESADSLPVCGGTETILIAEDDAPVRTLMKEVLGQYGYTVIEAVDGEDAVSRFTENRDRIQLLILDFILPKINGKEVYDEIDDIDRT